MLRDVFTFAPDAPGSLARAVRLASRRRTPRLLVLGFLLGMQLLACLHEHTLRESDARR